MLAFVCLPGPPCSGDCIDVRVALGITFVDVLEEGRALLFVERFVVGARQAVDETDRGKSEVRSPNYEVQSVRQSKFLIRHFPGAGDAELADQQEIVVHRILQRPSFECRSYDQGRMR